MFASNHTSQKWITNNDGTICIHDVSSSFKKVLNDECNLVSIFGRARQGKSFLMNCLSGEREIFRISNEKESCTQGIDISDKWLNLKEFSKIDGAKVIDGNIKIGFVDAEGQGDKDVSYDANLICPILLASKCIIFNWKGDLQKDHILSTLGIMTRAAKNVATDSGVNTKNNTSEAATSKKFGHLHIVFRDWQSVNSDENSTFQALFGMENTKDAATRDQIKCDVLQSFESIRVWLFEAPSESVSMLKTKLAFDKTSGVFKGQVRSLRFALSNQLRTPTLFAGRPLTGKLLVPVIKQIADSLNRGEVVLPSSAYLSMMRFELEKVRKDYEKELLLCSEKYLFELEQLLNNNNLNQQQQQQNNNKKQKFESGVETDEEFNTELYISFPTEKEVKKKLKNLFNEINNKYENEVLPSTIGGDYRDAKIMEDYPEQVFQIQKKTSELFFGNYFRLYTKWLLYARKFAENFLFLECQNIEKNNLLPMLEKDLDLKLNEILNKTLTLIDESYNVNNTTTNSNNTNNINNNNNTNNNNILNSNSTTKMQINDAIEILKKTFVEISTTLHNKNKNLFELQQQEAFKFLEDAVHEMDKTIVEAVENLNNTENNGYELVVLEKILNKKYMEVDFVLKKKLENSFFLQKILVSFRNQCEQLKDKMVNEYDKSKNASISNARDEAFNNLKLNAEAFLTFLQENILNDAKNEIVISNNDIVNNFENILNNSYTEAINLIRGWFSNESQLGDELLKNEMTQFLTPYKKNANQIVVHCVENIEHKKRKVREEEEEKIKQQKIIELRMMEEKKNYEEKLENEKRLLYENSIKNNNINNKNIKNNFNNNDDFIDIEDDENDDDNNSNNIESSETLANKSKTNKKATPAELKADKEKARLWAVSQLGIKMPVVKNNSKKTKLNDTNNNNTESTTTTASVVAKKTTTKNKKNEVETSKKTLAQQRLDAQNFALKEYGEKSLVDSPLNKKKSNK